MSDAQIPTIKAIQPDGRVHGAIVGCQDQLGRWLLIRRGLNLKAAPGKVCFPGGTVEVGEDPLLSAQREFKEELGVNVEIICQVWTHEFPPPRNLKLYGYLGQITDFDFQPCTNEVDEVLWMTLIEASAHPDVLPKTGEFLQALTAQLA